MRPISYHAISLQDLVDITQMFTELGHVIHLFTWCEPQVSRWLWRAWMKNGAADVSWLEFPALVVPVLLFGRQKYLYQAGNEFLCYQVLSPNYWVPTSGRTVCQMVLREAIVREDEYTSMDTWHDTLMSAWHLESRKLPNETWKARTIISNGGSRFDNGC